MHNPCSALRETVNETTSSLNSLNDIISKPVNKRQCYCMNTNRLGWSSLGYVSVSLREKCPYSDLFWFPFSRIWTEHGQILRISLYSVQTRETTDQNNSEYGDLLRSVCLNCVKHTKFCFFENSVLIKENKGHKKPAFWHINYTVLILEFSHNVRK